MVGLGNGTDIGEPTGREKSGDHTGVVVIVEGALNDVHGDPKEDPRAQNEAQASDGGGLGTRGARHAWGFPSLAPF